MPSARLPPAILLVACTLLLIGPAASAHAQTPSSDRVYLGGSLLIDIKRFSGDPTDNVLDGESLGVSLALGATLGSRWDAEVSFDLPASTETVRERSVILGRSTVEIQSITDNRAVSVTALARLRPARRGPVQLGLLAGMSILHLRQTFEASAPDSVPSSLIPRPVETVDYVAAPTIGVDAEVDWGAHLALVPAIHVTTFSAREVSGLLLRPRVGIRWRF
jgi:hypothetical protein